MKNLIEIKNLSKEFFPHKSPSFYALKNVNLSIPYQSIYGIIGMSGAGKSTLLRCLTGLESPSSGECFFENSLFPYDDQTALQRLRRRIGMVFQHFQLFSSRTVFQNIAYPLEIIGIPFSKRQSRVEELLTLIGLPHKKDCYPSQLSGGEKQRVGIARALANSPHLLLCDEPTSALDSKTAREILAFLQELNERLGLTIVIITHQLEAIKQICHRVAVLSKGQVIEEGEVKHIFTRPQQKVTQQLVHLNANSLPSELLTPVEGKCLIRLGFEGDQAKQPIISHLIKEFDVDVNILSGGLDYVQQTTIGHLFVELAGSSLQLTSALAFLENHHVSCEVIR